MSTNLIENAAAAIELATKGRSAGDIAEMNVGDLSVILGLLRSFQLESSTPVAWMRRWAFDGLDVMKLKKVDRPRGWAMAEVSKHQLFPDDVPLFGSGRATTPTPQGERK